MRSYLALELIGTFWFMGAVLACSEELDTLWVFCCVIALSYFMRAMLKYYGKREIANVEKDINITVNVDADGVRVSRFRPSATIGNING